MIFILILCVFLPTLTQCYSIKEIVPGDTDASLNLLFQGNALISYFDIYNSDVCSLPLEKIDNLLPLYKREVPITHIPNNYVISQAYRVDYYLNSLITNNPNTLDTVYTLDCKGDNPYECNPKSSSSSICIFGLRLSTYSVVSLLSKIKIDFGFSMGFSLILNNKDEMIAIFHTNNINTLFNDFVSNGHSLSIIVNSFYIKAVISNENQLTISIEAISNTGVINQLIRLEHMINTSNLKSINLKLDYNQKSIEECFSNNIIQIKRISESTTFFLKLSMNSQTIACLSIDLFSLIQANEVNISFIGKSSKNLLLLLSLFTESYDYHCSIPNKAIKCGYNPLDLNSRTIVVKNISQYNKDTIAFLYSYQNDSLKFCGTKNGLILIDSSYKLALSTCPYTVYYHPSEVKGIYIKNNLITLSLNKFYPIHLELIYSPHSFYDLCVNSSEFLQIGYCSCEICLRTLELTSTYYQVDKCNDKYNERCNCFDQSRITASSPYNFFSQTINLCAECYTKDNCSTNNKNGSCRNILQAGTTTIIHNDASIQSTSSSYINQNILYGQCDCQEKAPYYSINNNSFTYEIYYDNDSPEVLTIEMLSCLELLYEIKKLSNYDLWACYLFEIRNIRAYLVPAGGFQCTSCVFSSEFLQGIKKIDNNKFNVVRNCIYQYPSNFHSECMSVIKDLNYPSNQVFSGLLTHFRVECPGRTFDTNGSVCIPWFGFNEISFFTLVYKKTLNSAQWEEEYQCMNDICEPSSKADCLANNIKCVCYDSCPLDKGKYFNYYAIPCSGNGVCTKQSKCICDPGFLEPSCKIHCNETPGGCCTDNSDCLHNDSLKICKKNYYVTKVGYCDSS